jgi:putative heme-binding domain-containing protein
MAVSMNRGISDVRLFAACAVVGLGLIGVAFAEPPPTGPETENRFPPLKVPAGFTATLFACDPLIEYPSAIALGPRPGTLFVVADFMTGLGTEIVRRDEIRLIEDTDGDGYADKATVYAEGFNSIEGLTFHAGTVYAMHAPFLTALRDTDGDGKADDRHDIVTGLGLTPEENPVRLHCANGLVMGHDGWLYLALGDHGCDVKRPEGDRLVFEGGGILRCRPDGRDLHVFAHGLRNIYDVALDDELNVFVRDNENDGGDYKIRVCHSFFGADHGYPYLFYERPDEALPPLADLGLGSSAGGVCYREAQFPAEYRGNLFFCEWGRSVVRYRPVRSGSSFGRVEEIEFAAGAENDPYGFKPTDLVVDHDGSLIVADWADGQRPKRGRGRIYRIRHSDVLASGGRRPPGSVQASLDALISQLDSPSAYSRIEAQAAISARGPDGIKAMMYALRNGKISVPARLHAIWILAGSGNASASEKLYELAANDPDMRVQAQAVRAVADLTDPILMQHQLDAGTGDAKTAERLAALAEGKDPQVILEVVVALGRLRWAKPAEWLRQTITARRFPNESFDAQYPALAHAAQQTLRRAGNWPAVLQLLDLPDSEPMRRIALRALAEQADPDVVDGLLERLSRATSAASSAARRHQYADLLTRVYNKPGPWVYWGYRPPPRPANTVAWERTAAIEKALDQVLADRDPAVRLAVLRRIQREKIPTRLATLETWLKTERDAAAVAAILESLREHPADSTRDLLAGVVQDLKQSTANRQTALGLFAGGLDDSSAGRLLDLARVVEEGPVAVELIRRLKQHPKLNAAELLVARLGSTDPEVRAAAVSTAAELRVSEALGPILRMLNDPAAAVRQAAAETAGKLGSRGSIGVLLELTSDADAGVRRASFGSLRLLGERRAVAPAVSALADRETQLPALECIAMLGGPEQAAPVIDLANREQSTEILTLAIRTLAKWSGDRKRPAERRAELDRAIATLHGSSGVLAHWNSKGPLSEDVAVPLAEKVTTRAASGDAPVSPTADWHAVFAAGLESRVVVADKVAPTTDSKPGDRVWLAATDLVVPDSTPVQFLGSSTGKLHAWLNGRRVYQRDEERAFQPDSDRFDGVLEQGLNRLVILVTAPRERGEFHLRFRRKSSTAELEQFSQAALSRPGDAERGRKLFFDAEKLQCSKCHRVGDQGERIGPELTGLGDRFSRIHIVESILEPSRTVATGYQTIAFVLRDGRVLTGIKIGETDDMLKLADNEGKTHVVMKADIEEQKAQPQSTMPDSLVKQLTVDQFVDLIGYLASLKAQTRSPGTTP